MSLEIIGDLELLRSLDNLSREIREDLIRNPVFDTKRLRKLHILDSLRTNSIPSKEAQQIQSILLKHFEGVAYEGHLACNLAEVIYFVFFLFFNSSSNSGASPMEWHGLWLFHYFIREKVSPGPGCNHDPH